MRSVTLDVQQDGDPAGPPVVLLHGFPQTPAAWDRVRPALAAAGYRVLVPAQRGYGTADRPPRRRDYRTAELVADVVALLDRLGLDRAHLVGHDWGGVVAWAVAGAHPDRLHSLTVVSTPHPRALAGSLLTSTQGLRSWYVLAFQLPWLPERLLLARGGRRLHRALRGSGLSRGPAAAYVEAMRRPGALTAALHWYRALPFGRGPAGAGPRPGADPLRLGRRRLRARPGRGGPHRPGGERAVHVRGGARRLALDPGGAAGRAARAAAPAPAGSRHIGVSFLLGRDVRPGQSARIALP